MRSKSCYRYLSRLSLIGGSGSLSTALSPLCPLHIPGPTPLSPLTHSAFQEALPRFRCFLTSVHQNYLSCGPHPQDSAEWMNCSSLSSVFYVSFPILNLFFVCLKIFCFFRLFSIVSYCFLSWFSSFAFLLLWMSPDISALTVIPSLRITPGCWHRSPISKQ